MLCSRGCFICGCVFFLTGQTADSASTPWELSEESVLEGLEFWQAGRYGPICKGLLKKRDGASYSVVVKSLRGTTLTFCVACEETIGVFRGDGSKAVFLKGHIFPLICLSIEVVLVLQEVMIQLLKRNHRRCCERFHEGIVFLRPSPHGRAAG